MIMKWGQIHYIFSKSISIKDIYKLFYVMSCGVQYIIVIVRMIKHAVKNKGRRTIDDN